MEVLRSKLPSNIPTSPAQPAFETAYFLPCGEGLMAIEKNGFTRQRAGSWTSATNTALPDGRQAHEHHLYPWQSFKAVTPMPFKGGFPISKLLCGPQNEECQPPVMGLSSFTSSPAQVAMPIPTTAGSDELCQASREGSTQDGSQKRKRPIDEPASEGLEPPPRKCCGSPRSPQSPSENATANREGAQRPTRASVAPAPQRASPYARSPEWKITHKLAERKRRREMRGTVEQLQAILPADLRGRENRSKKEIISLAITYIEQLSCQLAALRQTTLPTVKEPGEPCAMTVPGACQASLLNGT
ncbi:hypothetical protein NMY22_g17106 [Coprinellus aureogranulatus]|nr:hypothetical protein NMY22_g17106 [Coprinellus aureogranulatus]